MGVAYGFECDECGKARYRANDVASRDSIQDSGGFRTIEGFEPMPEGWEWGEKGSLLCPECWAKKPSVHARIVNEINGLLTDFPAGVRIVDAVRELIEFRRTHQASSNVVRVEPGTIACGSGVMRRLEPTFRSGGEDAR